MPEIVKSDPQVDVSSSAPRLRSKVPFSYKFANTLRFGEYSPFFVMEAVNGDKIPFSCKHDVRSLNLKSPILSDISIHKDYFFVPNESILPLNWDKIYTNPVVGDDVNSNLVNCMLPFSENNMPSLYTIYGKYLSQASTFFAQSDNASRLNGFRCLLLSYRFAEKFLSSGSLLNVLGCKTWKLFTRVGSVSIGQLPSGLTFDTNTGSFDDFYDLFVKTFISDYSSSVQIYDGVSSYYALTVENLSRLIRSNNAWYFSAIGSSAIPFGSNTGGFNVFRQFTSAGDKLESLNISRVIAYQLVCSHFYSNDKVDYVYSAELYRQNVEALIRSLVPTKPYFSYNGVNTFYDTFSGKSFFDIFTKVNTTTGSSLFGVLADFSNVMDTVFDFNRSLRYVDYFSGSRTRPLAVGDVNVSVSANLVNAVDITKGIQKQRFLNFVNRTGRRFEEYVSKLGGHYVAPDYHNPFVLALTSDKIMNSEIENTGAGQLADANSTTSVFRSGSSRYVFEFDADRPSIVIGIAYFDLPRFYNTVTERQFFHSDRYDMFNPFMQFVGDQEVYRHEYFMGSLFGNTPFGYQLRNIEYKARVDQCAGAFANEYLPSWLYMNSPDPIRKEVISPDFIRSFQHELDKYFISIDGISLGTYFHFICMFSNICEPTRPMAYQPQIL